MNDPRPARAAGAWVWRSSTWPAGSATMLMVNNAGVTKRVGDEVLLRVDVSVPVRLVALTAGYAFVRDGAGSVRACVWSELVDAAPPAEDRDLAREDRLDAIGAALAGLDLYGLSEPLTPAMESARAELVAAVVDVAGG